MKITLLAHFSNLNKVDNLDGRKIIRLRSDDIDSISNIDKKIKNLLKVKNIKKSAKFKISDFIKIKFIHGFSRMAFLTYKAKLAFT